MQVGKWSIQNWNFSQSSIMDGFDFANNAQTYGDAASTITLGIILVYLSITVIMQCLVSRFLYLLAKTY